MNKATVSLYILLLVSSFLITASRINLADAATTIFIQPNGEVAGTDSIQRNGNMYTFTANISGQIQVEKSDITIDGDGYTLSRPAGVTDSFGFTLYNVNNVTITDTKIVNFTNALSISLGSWNNITGNYLKDSVYSVQVTDSSYNNIIAKNTIVGNTSTTTDTIGVECVSDSQFNTIFENMITDTDYGMRFDGSSSYNTIANNNLTNNRFGIWLWGAPLNTISENTITRSYWGMYLSPAQSNTIFGNTIAHSSPGGGGIYFLSGSNSNVVSGNTLAHNYYGFRLTNSSDNRITQNNFINNTRHVQTPSFSDFVNSFNASYPFGGNFWSNYTGVDFYKGIGQNITGYDGIGDTSHAIDANNTDNYPLVGSFSSHLAYSDLRVETVSNSTVSNFTYNNEDGTIKMQAINSSSSQQTGFMRATIPKNLIHEPYTVAIDSGLTQVLNLNETLYDNATHRLIYFAYVHSTHEISIQGTPTDITPPSILVLSPEAKAYNKQDIPLTFTINETTSWIGFALDSQSNVTISENTTLTGLPDGAHRITVYANDTNGNMGNSTTVNFSIDVTPPALEILSPENTTYNTRDIQITVTLSEPTSWIGYSLDNNLNVTINSNTTLTGLTSGKHAITVYALDNAGNTGASDEAHFSVEVPLPIAWIAAAIIVVVALAAFTVYYFKIRKHTRTPPAP